MIEAQDVPAGNWFLWWQCPVCLWFDWVPADLGQPLCPNCMRSMMLYHLSLFWLSDVQAAGLPHLPCWLQSAQISGNEELEDAAD